MLCADNITHTYTHMQTDIHIHTDIHTYIHTQQCGCYSIETLFFCVQALILHKLHIWALTVHCTLYSEISDIMFSPSCSQLYSEFKALCEACRHSEVQVRSVGSPDLTLSTLLFRLASVWKCLHHMFVHLLCFSSSFCYPHTTIRIHGIFEK